MRFLLPSVLLSLSLLGSLKAAEESPFVKKFGGPYKTGVDQQFRIVANELAMTWKNCFAMLSKDALKDKKDVDLFNKEEIDPRIAKLDAKTNEEKKIKEAALFVRQLMSSFAHRDSMKEEDLKNIQVFLDTCKEPIPPKTEADKIGNALILFQAYSVGLTLEEIMKLMEEQSKDAR